MTKQTVKNQDNVVLACPILSNGTPIGTGEKPAIVSIDCGNLSSSIGKLLDVQKSGTELRILGSTVKIPSGTFSAKFNTIVAKLVEVAFKGCDDHDIPKSDEGKALIEGMKGKLHFNSLRYNSVKEALKIRVANYKENVKAEKNEVRSIPANVVLITETGTLKEVNKAFKDGGRNAVIALIESKKLTKVIGWTK